MRRVRDIYCLFCVSVVLSCGPGASQQQPGYPTPNTTTDQVSEMTGGTCLEPDDVNSPWLVGLDGTSRGTIARNVDRGMVLVKQGECGTCKMLADCFIRDLQYEDIPANTIRPDAIEVSNRRQLQKKVPLAVAKYAAQMDDQEHWSLDYVDAGEKSYSGNLPKIEWDKLRPTCRAATHYVYKVTRGAFQLSMLNEAERLNEGNIGPADFKKRAERRKAEKSRDGDYEGCAESNDSNVPACAGLIRMWVEPIPERLLPKNTPLANSSASSSGSTLAALLSDSSEEGPTTPTPGVGTKEYKANLEKSWAAVKKAARGRDTEGKLELYQAFLSEYPVDNPYAGKARKKVEDWETQLNKEQEERDQSVAEQRERQNAISNQENIRRAKEKAENTAGTVAEKLAAWERFAAEYPGDDNIYLATAQRKIESLKAQVEKERTENSLETSPETSDIHYSATLEKAWVAVKRESNKRDIMGKISLYQAFLSKFPNDNPYADKVRNSIETWEQQLIQEERDREEQRLMPEFFRSKTDWVNGRIGPLFALGGTIMEDSVDDKVGFSWSGSAFHLKWKHFYWDILRGFWSVEPCVNFIAGTSVGIPWSPTDTGRHEIRTGLGLMGGYSKCVEGDVGVNQIRSQKSYGPFINPEFTYTYYLRKHFGIEIGLGIILTAATPSNETQDSTVTVHEKPPPMLDFHVGIAL